MKKFVWLLLCGALLCTLLVAVSCGAGDATSEESTLDSTSLLCEGIDPQPDTTDAPFAVTVSGMPLSDYVIVYSESELAKYAEDERYADLFPAYDFDRESAERLSALFLDLTGCQLPVVKDSEREAGEKEILVGKTDRNKPGTALSVSSLDTDECCVKVANGKLSVAGGEYGTTWHTIDFLETVLMSAKEKGESFDFEEGYLLEEEYHLKKIVCIGDSITFGVGSKLGGSDAFTLFSYPTQLGRILWKDAVVKAYGDRGKTMRSDFYNASQNHAYTRTTTYTSALKAAGTADIVTVMLGTNDSQRLWEYEKKNWDADATTKYHESALAIFAALQEKNPSLDFVLCNAVAYFGSERYGAQGVREAQASLLSLLNDAGYPTVFQDMYEVTKNMGAYFADKLHPDNEGHLAMAESLAETVRPLIEKE